MIVIQLFPLFEYSGDWSGCVLCRTSLAYLDGCKIIEFQKLNYMENLKMMKKIVGLNGVLFSLGAALPSIGLAAENLEDYVEDCKRELGIAFISGYSCFDGVEAGDTGPETGGLNSVDNYLGKVKLDNPNVDAIFLCRDVEGAGASATAGLNGFILQNRVSGKTCFFDAKKGATANIPSLESDNADEYWAQPEDMDGSCEKCHTTDPFIVTEPLAQAFKQLHLINNGRNLLGAYKIVNNDVDGSHFEGWESNIAFATETGTNCANSCHRLANNSRNLLIRAAMEDSGSMSPLPGSVYAFDVDSANKDWGCIITGAGKCSWDADDFGSTNNRALSGDVNGDGNSDRIVYSHTDGAWECELSNGSACDWNDNQWGSAEYLPLIADVNGDGKVDRIVYRPSDGDWGCRITGGGVCSWDGQNWGSSLYTPQMGDLDGDGKADRIVYNSLTGNWGCWITDGGKCGWDGQTWGGGSYLPLIADIDGDGKADRIVYDSVFGDWGCIITGGNKCSWDGEDWGGVGFQPLVGDLNGDGKIDRISYRASDGEWGCLLTGSAGSSCSWNGQKWGSPSYSPLIADTNGDGIPDRVLHQY